MLAGRTERRDVPHEAGAWIEFRTLSGRELDEAEHEVTKRQTALANNFTAETLQAIRAQADSVTRSPKDSYDKDTLIRYSISAWSLDEVCSDANKMRLDASTREWAIDVIVEMNVRPLALSSDSDSVSSGENSHRSSGALITSTPAE